MKNYEQQGEILRYAEIIRLLKCIKSSPGALADRDYCIALLILEYGWKIESLLSKKVSDGLDIVNKNLPGCIFLKPFCEGRNHNEFLFPGRNGSKMQARNIQLRFIMWSQRSKIGRPATPNNLVDANRIRALCREFLLNPFALSWTGDEDDEYSVLPMAANPERNSMAVVFEILADIAHDEYHYSVTIENSSVESARMSISMTNPKGDPVNFQGVDLTPAECRAIGNQLLSIADYLEG